MLNELYHIATPWAKATKSQINVNRMLGVAANVLYPVYCAWSPLPKQKTTQGEKMVVSLTTFPLRIGKVHLTIQSILRQSRPADRVLLWLSKEEFPEEAQLPENLLRLKEAGLPVMCREVPRMVNGKEAPLSLDWYWDHVLSPQDLKTVIDLLYFSHLPAGQIRQLAEKLKRLQCRSFEDGKEGIRNLPLPQNLPDVRETLVLLSQALCEKRQISFYYDHYEVDGKRHHGVSPSGEARCYIVHPFQVIASDDRYCLLCNVEGREDISYFFVDRMADIMLLSAPARGQKSLAGADASAKLDELLVADRDIYTGNPVEITFEADVRLLTDIQTDFGKRARLISASPDKVTMEVTLPQAAMKAWALKKAPLVKVLSPSYLVREVKEAAQSLARLYGL